MFDPVKRLRRIFINPKIFDICFLYVINIYCKKLLVIFDFSVLLFKCLKKVIDNKSNERLTNSISLKAFYPTYSDEILEEDRYSETTQPYIKPSSYSQG